MKRSHPNLNHPLLYKQGQHPLKMVEISHNNKGGDDNSEIQITLEKGVISKDQLIQESEKALRDLLERQTREAAVEIEAIKRAEEMANRHRAILEEAEKRERLELLKKATNPYC
ncbi:hypothetical protein PIB30_024289 [Stylosanthes scabra]|uniref:Uncharacterized protein n=1 Tax=Stylosanthes scabra TaxID=79078 RepID=A0ABU6W9R2_9FABA|nr:hypothetical protein [Stylosanthes scabra]